MRSILILSLLTVLLLVVVSSCVRNKHKNDPDKLPTNNLDPMTITKNNNGGYSLKESVVSIPEGNDFTMKAELVEDNRCPPRVNCIRAGELVVKVLLENGTTKEEVTLTHPTEEKQGSTNTTTFNGKTIEFVGGTPKYKYASPDSDEKIDIPREFYFKISSADRPPVKEETTPAGIPFIINKQFSLRQSQTGTLKQDDFTIEVVSIRDSRCPPGVNCIRAGEVDVDVILKSGTKEETKTLTFPTAEKRGSTNTAAFDGKVINFLGASAKKSPTSGMDKPSIPKQLGGLDLYFEVKSVKSAAE